MKRWIVLPVLAGLCSFAGVCDPGTVDVFPELEDRFSFEDDLEGWSAAVSDLGEPPAPWSVGVSAAAAFAGSRSVVLSLDNRTSQGRVFLRRRFQAFPNTDYSVEVSVQLGTADAGPVNAWSVVGGVSTSAPAAGGSLVTMGDTDGGGAAPGVQWVERTATFDLRTGPQDGRIWVGLGVWGTSAHARDYFLDDVRVTVRRR